MSGTGITSVSPFYVEIERDEPYLGALREGDLENDSGYFVRGGNRTVYPKADRSLLLRIETSDGVTGWGETYGIIAPQAAMEIIRDLFTPFLLGRDPGDVSVIYDDLYDLMRVRGSSGGLYHDALAAVDIALWDICGKLSGLSVSALLGGTRHRKIPAYVSGLPGETQSERVALARRWREDGFDSFKFASPAVDDVVDEFRALREELGPDVRLAADLHWHHNAAEALALAQAIEPYRPWFIEAPCAPEDIAGLGVVTRGSRIPVAAGEEWRTSFDLRDRLAQGAPAIFQPEMAHTGITQFMRMAHLASANHIPIIPHATIGIGIFLTASLRVSATLQGVIAHEYQHTVVPRMARFVLGGPVVKDGAFVLSDSPGLGIEPTEVCLTMLRT